MQLGVVRGGCLSESDSLIQQKPAAAGVAVEPGNGRRRVSASSASSCSAGRRPFPAARSRVRIEMVPEAPGDAQSAKTDKAHAEAGDDVHRGGLNQADDRDAQPGHKQERQELGNQVGKRLRSGSVPAAESFASGDQVGLLQPQAGQFLEAFHMRLLFGNHLSSGRPTERLELLVERGRPLAEGPVESFAEPHHAVAARRAAR